MDNLKLTGQNLGQVFKSKSGCLHTMYLFWYEAKGPSLELKTCQKTTFRFFLIRYHDPC